MKVYKIKEGQYKIGDQIVGVGHDRFAFNDSQTKVRIVSSNGMFESLPLTKITDLQKEDGTYYTGYENFMAEMEGIL